MSTANHKTTQHDLDVVRTRYANDDTELIAADIGCSKSVVYRLARILGVKKSPAFMQEKKALRVAKLVQAGTAQRFRKDGTPWNKGKPHPSSGGTLLAHFQPGHRMFSKPLGSERVHKGYLELKISDTGNTSHDYVLFHHLVWLAAGRQIPPGHIVVFRDGNKRNFALENLEMLSRQQHIARHTIHQYPPDLVQLSRLQGTLRKVLNNRSKTP